MKHIFLIICLISAVITISCENSAVNEQLNRAEQMMNEYPDSALMILSSIDSSTDLSTGQNARYALLLSQALDKNYIDVANDSLIRIAVRYYDNHGTTKDKYLSLYYLGRVLYNARNFAEAGMVFTKAEQLLPEIDDNLLKGLLYTQLGLVYEEYYANENAVAAYQKAYSYYDKANKPIHRNYAKYHEATACINIPRRHQQIDRLYNEALHEAIERKDSTLISTCISDLIHYYTTSGQIDKAINMLPDYMRNFSIENKTSQFFSSLSYIAAFMGDLEKSKEYLTIAETKSYTNSDSVMIMICTARIAELRHEYKVAYNELCKAKIIENSAVHQRLEQPIITAQKEFLEKELEFNRYKQKSQLEASILIGILAALLCTAIFIYLRYRIKSNEFKLSEYSDIIMELQQKVHNGNSVMAELLQSSFKDQFKFLNSISDIIFTQSDNPKGQKIAYNEIKHIINHFTDKSAIQELETLVNKYCDNVMDKLRNEVPDLNEDEYRQLCYHYAGFSGKLISILLERNQSNIYLRKSRLKNKIRQKAPNDLDTILKYLS